MNAPKPASSAESPARGLPSRSLKLTAAAARCLLWLVAAAWALFMLTWGALHAWIVPRIDDWRPELERWASAQLGIAVQVGDIRASHGHAPPWLPRGFWGLMPTLALQDVRLFDPAGREALRLPLVQASLSPASVWRRGFEQVLIEKPVLDVRRTPEGRIEVAGLDMGGDRAADGSALDWFFAQPEFVIRQGTVRWSDELMGQPPLALSQVDLTVRSQRRRHEFRLDASPPPEAGARLSLRGRLRAPLIELPSQAPQRMPWHDWQGELYAESAQVDVSHLRAYLDLSRWQAEVRAGRGAVRAWADVEGGAVRRVMADIDLRDVDTTLGQGLPPLALETVAGRLDALWDAQGFDLLADDLRFRTAEGQAWPGGQKMRLRHREAPAGAQAAGTRLEADRIDLAALAAVASRLPLPAELHRHLAELRPSGRIEGLRAAWRPAPAEPRGLAYEAQGRVAGLTLAGQPSGRQSSHGNYPEPGRPGVRNADIAFDLTHKGGQARIAVRGGALELPDVFEDPVLPLDRLDAQARWTVAGERIDVALDEAFMSNADAEGTATARWHTADPAASGARSRFPGVLDLTARLTRADATRVHRYLPLNVSAEARRYLREATLAGASPRVDFRVRGDLWDAPFAAAAGAAGRGEFRIAAQLRGIGFDYVPRHLRAPGERPWPALKDMDGELVFERDSLRITGLKGGADPLPGLRLSQGSVAVASLSADPTLDIASRVEGPANQILAIVRDSPLDAMTGGALAQASATGAASGQFELRIPLDRMPATTVKGAVQLAGNDVRISPAAPVLARASGRVAFSEQGFAISGAQARVWGGELRFEGGMQTDAQGAAHLRLEGQGTATAEGLRQGGLGIASQLAERASGSAAYRVQLGFRGGAPEITVTSPLQGMAVDLPAPLGKPADTALPMRFEQSVLSLRPGAGGEPAAATDRLRVDVGPAAARALSLHYERDIAGDEARVLRGAIAMGLSGDETVAMPAAGVQANLRLDEIDIDAWTALLPPAGQGGAAASHADGDPMAYLPTVAALRAGLVRQGGRSFHDVVLGGERSAGLWRANVSGREIDGYVEYRQPADRSAGHVFARLARLELSQAATTRVEEILQQPSSLPALDLAVQDFALNGRRLGRVEIEAVNAAGNRARAPEWRLTRLQMAVPEARLNATGNWAPANGGGRRTGLDFHLDIRDAGQLLARFGRAGVVRGGQGVIEGHIGWQGSPFGLDYPSMSGQLHTEIEKGQFLQVEPGAAKLLGVLSLQALPRRLALDFRDVFSQGFAFDFIRGDALIAQGVLATNNLQMKGVNAAVLMEGSADIDRETQDLKVVVVPEINAGTAALIATAINPAVGLGTFLAQFLLRQPLQSAATQHLRITGGWADPKVDKAAPPAPAP